MKYIIRDEKKKLIYILYFLTVIQNMDKKAQFFLYYKSVKKESISHGFIYLTTII
jgi:hypothetical protein